MSEFDQRRQEVLTPALEGSKAIRPANFGIPLSRGHPRSQQGREMFTPYPRGYYPGGMLPPIRMPYRNYVPADRMQVPTLMPRPRMPYAGPPSLMPYWGGYSVGGRYFPAGFLSRVWSAVPAGHLIYVFQDLQQTKPERTTRYTRYTAHLPKPVKRKNEPHEKKERRDSLPEPRVIPVPMRMPKQVPLPPPPPIYNIQPPPPPPTIPIPIIIRQPKRVEVKTVPYVLPKKTVKKTSKKASPGSEPLRRFRHVALAATFIAHLRANVNKSLSNRPSSVFLFGIILKEIVAALHRIYLNPNGNIYPVLNDIIGPNCYDLATLVHGGQMDTKEESVLCQELQYVIENLVYHITEIMPSTGVLGTHRKSAVFELIRSGKRFPDGYFWQVEMDRLNFSENGRTLNVTDSDSFMLQLGIFISRSLVTTILMKPIDYGLCSQALTDVAERNLRIVASAMLFLVRRISIQRGRGIMDMPAEISKYLYSDQEMNHVYSKLSRTFNYCEGLLREWGTEYIRRLRASSMQADR